MSYSRGSDVVVEALNAINTSQERERHANDARKGNIYGEFHFSVSGATSADVAQAKKGSDWLPITPEAILTTGSAGTFSRVILRSIFVEIVLY